MKAGEDVPAFPEVYTNDADEVTSRPGINIRDYFAAAALTGWIAMHADSNTRAPEEKVAAQAAYEFADAMIKERNK